MTRVFSFGRAMSAQTDLRLPRSVAEVQDLVSEAKRTGRKITVRGAGQSYGDAALGHQSLTIGLTNLTGIVQFDSTQGIIDVEPGVTIRQLCEYTLPHGWWPPVVPGTAKVTVGGCAASNIHGKNQFRVGTFGEHILELDLVTADGSVRTISKDHPDFFAVVGGFGLLGVITRLRIQLRKVDGPWLNVRAISCRDWVEQFRCFEENESSADYMVSWVDGFSDGRGLFHSATYDRAPGNRSMSFRPTSKLGPALIPLLRQLNHRGGMRIINSAKHQAGRWLEHEKTHLQTLDRFSFLLDRIDGWEAAYWPEGLIQVQSFLPKAAAPEVFRRQFEQAQKGALETHLAVMKRHRPDPFLLGCNLDGYSLAMDFRMTARNQASLADCIRDLHDIAAAHGGRFYPAKDGRLSAEQFTRNLPAEHLAKWRAARNQFDPEQVWSSDLGQRLGLI